MEVKKVKKYYHEKKIFYIRLELIKDFLFSLLNITERTFLGDDLMTIQNKKEHLEYCLDVTVSSFEKENIFFKKSPKLTTFLFDIFFQYYYDIPKSKKNIEDFKIRISNILSYSHTKTDTQLKEMSKYYQHIIGNIGDFLVF